MTIKVLVLIIGLITGLVVAGSGIAGTRRIGKLRGSIAVDATIVAVEHRFTGKSDAYFPVLSFRIADGSEVRATAVQGRVFSYPELGTQVRVRYDPANPADAYIDSLGLRYGGICCVIVGTGLVTLAVAQAV